MLKICSFCLAIILSAFFPLKGNCQDMLDVKVDLKPYSYVRFYDFTQQKPVKTVSYLIKKYYKDQWVKTDTVYKETLTKDGKRLSYISFQENKPSSVTQTEYFSTKNIVKSTIKNIKRPNDHFNTIITKDKTGKDVLNYMVSFPNGDTTSRTYKRYFYNADNLLVKTTYETSYKGMSAATSATIYEYVDKDMVLAKYFADLNRLGFYQATAYRYNENHLPIEKRTYQVRNGTADTPALYNYYTYDKGLLIAERHEQFNDKGKIVETTVDYTYDAKKLVTKLYTKIDTLFQEIDYAYENDKIKKVTIHTNTERYLGKELVVLERTVAMPFTYERMFEYDQYGNLFITKEFINGELYRELIKELIYY